MTNRMQASNSNQSPTNKSVFTAKRTSTKSQEERLYDSKFIPQTQNLNKDSEAVFDIGAKRSCLSPTLLSNYVLGISLLKNIAMKYSYQDSFS